MSSASALFVLVVLCAPAAHAESWESRRDRIQAEAENDERRKHPWAGIYLAGGSQPHSTLCLSASGEFHAGAYDSSDERVGQAAGRVEAVGSMLRLDAAKLAGQDVADVSGEYNVLRWGDIRCLLRVGEEPLFLDCVATRCTRSFLCTRGLYRGTPTLSEAFEKARRAHPLHRAYAVKVIDPPQKRSWGLQYRVHIGGGSSDGLKKGDRLYWADDDAWMVLTSAGEKTSVGDLQLGRERRRGPGVRAGSSVYRWAPRTDLSVEFLNGSASVDWRR